MKHKVSLLVLLLSVLCLPQAVQAYDFSATAPSGQTLFYTIGNNSVSIVNPLSGSSYYSCVSGDLTIPDTVTHNGINYAVTSIGYYAFRGCSSLTSVTIPNSVTSIGWDAFRECTGLTSVTIGNSVTSIGNNAFNYCNSLTSVTIGNSVTSIGDYAFYSCSGLTSVTIPNSVTSIGTSAFGRCSGLTSVTIPNSVTSIGMYAFYGCSGLTSVTIPNSVTSIGNSAFENCSGLTSVTIGNSVTYIGECAFRDCSGLTSIIVEAGNTHYDSRDSCNAIIQTDVGLLIQGCQSTVIPEGITAIGNAAFRRCSGLTSVTIPNSVTSIGEFAFVGCSGLTSVTIPNSVTSIGNYAFNNCSGLTSVIVEAGNTHYDSRDSCNALIQTDLGLLILGCQSTVIPEGITAIVNAAFGGCSGLTSVTIPNSVTSIGYGAFSGCSGLTSVTIPNSVTSIGNYAFDGCSGLTSVTIGNSVTSIGTYAFQGCSGLTSVTIPNSVTSIGDNAFRDCSGLTSVTIPNSVTSIGTDAFWGCDSLTSVYCLATAPPTLGYLSYFYSANIYVPCEAVTAYQGANEWSNHASRIHGTPTLDFVYSFASGNDTMGSVNVSVANCDSNITVTATAATGYQFVGWSDGGSGNPRTFHLTGDTAVTALFDYATYVIVGQSDTARGTVTGSDTVHYGDTVTLTATANNGYHFTQWSDGDTDNPRVLSLTQDTTLTAYFEINTYQLTVLANDTTLGTVAGSGNFTHGSTVTVTASATPGNRFDRWDDNTLLVNYTFTLTGNLQLIAIFVPSDTVFVHDTTLVPYAVHDTTYITIHDTTLVPYAVHDTTIVHDTTLVPYAVHDTTIIHDTTLVPYAVHDTTYITIHDTTLVPYAVHDTTYITWTDTVISTVYDTVINTLYDTVDNYIYDTTIVYQTDTLWLTDTVYIHDTVYITEEGIGDVVAINAKVYSSQGQVVVEGAEGHPVTLIDAVGRQLATKRDEYMPVRFDVPASGTYLVKIGDYAARRVVVIR